MDTKTLKAKILQLAIQGKLVAQDSNDEPASVLLEKVNEEKEILVKEGKIKKEKLLAPITENEIPFELPNGWQMVRLGNIAQYKKGPFGSSITKGMFVPKSETSIKVYEQKNAIQKNCSIGDYYITKEKFEELKSFELYPGDIIISCAGTIGETYIMPDNIEKGIINQALMKVTLSKYVVKEFFLIYFKYILMAQITNESKGSAIKNIPPLDYLKNMVFTIPPLREQKRIVEKVNELFDLIEKLDNSKYDLIETINKTRNKILNEALQGKLLPQDSTDEPASELIKRIEAVGNKLVEEGKIKREKALATIREDEIPYVLPESWSWVRVPFVTYFQEGPGIMKKDFREEGVPLIRIAGMHSDIVSLNGCNYLDPKMVEEKWKHFKLELGDLVLSSSATMGKISTVDESTVGCIPYTGLIRFKMLEGLADKYFIYFVLSNTFIEQINTHKSGTTIQHFGPTHLNKMLIPLPPINEQYRIIEKVESIMKLLNQVEMELKHQTSIEIDK